MPIVAFVQRAGESKGTRMRFEEAVPPGGEVTVIVHNISEQGMVLETDEPFALGEPLDINLPQSGAARATVAWISGRLIGFDFDMPISRIRIDAEQFRNAVSITPVGMNQAHHMESFGLRLRRLRRALGMSQGELAKLLGVSDPAVCGWELNKSRPKPGRMNALAKLLGVSLADLVREETVTPLSTQIASAREAIARTAGTTQDRVRISIDM